jgi:hydrocephalus-inducing protein
MFVLCSFLGETVFVSLYGAAIDMNIRLDKNSLIMEKTYMSLASQRTITIHNHSNIIAHFQWKVFANQEEEDREKHRFVTKITPMQQRGVGDLVIMEKSVTFMVSF